MTVYILKKAIADDHKKIEMYSNQMDEDNDRMDHTSYSIDQTLYDLYREGLKDDMEQLKVLSLERSKAKAKAKEN